MKLTVIGVMVLLAAGVLSARGQEKFALADVRRDALAYCDALRVPGKPLGWWYLKPGSKDPNTLYPPCDMAIIRAVMGEDLRKTVSAEERAVWIDHINSFAQPDGTYKTGIRAIEHANGTVIGGLGALGGKQKYPVRLYDALDTPEKVGPWLEKINWKAQWSGSHVFWGAMHCYSQSSRCTPEWREAVFTWLDANLDEKTGWWRKGVTPDKPIEPLGGAAHIWPMYEHNGRRFPYPHQVIDSILAMQKPDGSWLKFGGYMDLDALYGLKFMSTVDPHYRHDEVLAAARRHGKGLVERWAAFRAAKPDIHQILAAVGGFGLLQQLLPEEYVDDAKWTDIFSDPALYRVKEVEVLNP